LFWGRTPSAPHKTLPAARNRAPAVEDRALVQKLACAYWVFHYAKRIFETYTVHV
jgi:hypothetical protein